MEVGIGAHHCKQPGTDNYFLGHNWHINKHAGRTIGLMVVTAKLPDHAKP